MAASSATFRFFAFASSSCIILVCKGSRLYSLWSSYSRAHQTTFLNATSSSLLAFFKLQDTSIIVIFCCREETFSDTIRKYSYLHTSSSICLNFQMCLAPHRIQVILQQIYWRIALAKIESKNEMNCRNLFPTVHKSLYHFCMTKLAVCSFSVYTEIYKYKSLYKS